jgi:hypothetical protein
MANIPDARSAILREPAGGHSSLLRPIPVKEFSPNVEAFNRLDRGV